ncbi:elicitin-like protein [Phytophthora infestans T30-4]|uniref:Elicitin n=2 Tax=Phytophthora infestans TaxID=4787 RepID=D0NKU2_PHYIT|nr:elicitin-like protein [Phytophthora infestans T30-4]EEY60228.1 elicitin-like protein [Phytophthora infestans T30-4]KAF4136697.1 Elicitin [Phytophthora infestans]|eukprot:XP_002900435.1 elicitin-like protein [Phytophthora infestans T30-4]
MNTYIAVAAAALAVIASVNGEACSTTQQASAYTSMVGLLQGTSLSTCASDSGYNMLYATALPTAEQTAAMCKVDACHELIKNVQATNPPDCDLNIPTSGAIMNVKSLADNFEPGCSPSTPVTEAPAARTAAPAASTDAPKTEAPATESTPSHEQQSTTPAATPAVTPAATPTTPIAC